jgi:hypothetical protein
MISRRTKLNRTLSAGPLCCLLSLVWLAATVTGCRLGQPGSASFASVKIPGKTPAQIQEATMQVFREDGYATMGGGANDMVFQREASRMTNLGQNGIVDSYYGAQTAVRVRVELVDLGTGTFRLQCQAYLVRNPGDSFFEDSHPMALVRRMPYQMLLDKVAKRLKSA